MYIISLFCRIVKEGDFMGRPKKEKPNHGKLYEVKITVGHTFDGKPIRKSFYSKISKADAKAKAEQYKIDSAVHDITGEHITEPKATTFENWAIKWLETYKKDTVKEQTYLFTYKSNVEKYLIPHFKKAKLPDIKQIDIQNYFNKVVNAETKKPLSKTVLDKHKLILHSIFDAAIDNDLCYKNPVKAITYPKCADKSERNTYNLEQYEKFKQCCYKHKHYDMLLLSLLGLRRSELLGLQWTDIDFENKTLSVRRAVTQTVGAVIVDEPKTKTSMRTLPLFDDTLNLFREIQVTADGSLYIIKGSENDTPLSPHSFADAFARKMKRISKEAGIPILTPHELRHTYGTLLREKGVDIYTIQKVLGHSDISTTAKIYVHNDIDVLRKNLK